MEIEMLEKGNIASRMCKFPCCDALACIQRIKNHGLKNIFTAKFVQIAAASWDL